MCSAPVLCWVYHAARAMLLLLRSLYLLDPGNAPPVGVYFNLVIYNQPNSRRSTIVSELLPPHHRRGHQPTSWPSWPSRRLFTRRRATCTSLSAWMTAWRRWRTPFLPPPSPSPSCWALCATWAPITRATCALTWGTLSARLWWR